eukprot:TRINITY_DN55334_c0_g1_i1.p1 TRINITY_DN55334_c0_g1~~TRINITY_DN55334_c0_g1_i1.p1  ORF type:complete len:514 (-),score=29.54 TRINITY_DN55334_c0_g1_i1:256-1731(-)
MKKAEAENEKAMEWLRQNMGVPIAERFQEPGKELVPWEKLWKTQHVKAAYMNDSAVLNHQVTKFNAAHPKRWFFACNSFNLILAIVAAAMVQVSLDKPPCEPHCEITDKAAIPNCMALVEKQHVGCKTSDAVWKKVTTSTMSLSSVVLGVVFALIGWANWPTKQCYNALPALCFCHGEKIPMYVSEDPNALLCSVHRLTVWLEAAVKNVAQTTMPQNYMAVLEDTIVGLIRFRKELKRQRPGNDGALYLVPTTGDIKMFTLPIKVTWHNVMGAWWHGGVPRESTVDFVLDGALQSSLHPKDVPKHLKNKSSVKVRLALWGHVSIKIQQQDDLLQHSILGKELLGRIENMMFPLQDLKNLELYTSNRMKPKDEDFNIRLGATTFPMDSGSFCTAISPEDARLASGNFKTVRALQKTSDDAPVTSPDIAYIECGNRYYCAKSGQVGTFCGADWLFEAHPCQFLTIWRIPKGKKSTKEQKTIGTQKTAFNKKND